MIWVGSVHPFALAPFSLSLWLDSDVDRALDAVKSEFDRLAAQDADFIFVTNEIGLGGVSTDPLQRRFTDLQGWVNQYIAQRAGSVVLMVSGIPIKVK